METAPGTVGRSAQPTQALRLLVKSGDLRAALIYLNALTDYRFTAMYRFDKDTLVNRHFVDRQNPDLLQTDQISVPASYCVFIRDTAAAFRLADSFEDARVAAHPKKQLIRSYCGVPLTDEAGTMFGSVCHFDFEPRAVRESDVELLESIAPLLHGS